MAIYTGGIFLTIRDLMKLTGSESYNSSGNQHRAIRDCLSIGKNKRNLTIYEFCKYEQIDFEYVWKYLRG